MLDYQKQVNPQHGLTAVRFLDARVVTGGYARLAFQHREMIKKAIQMLEAYPDLAR